MTGRRSLVAACLGLAAAAGLLWGASTAVWYRVTAQVPLRGPVPVEFDGSEAAPALTGVALLALAGIAGIVATAGPLRRLLAVLLGLAGGAIGVVAVRAWVSPPFGSGSPDSALPAPPPGVPVDALRDQPVQTTAVPLLALAGGLVLLAVGVLVLLAGQGMPRLGARYAAPGGRSRAPEDPDRAAWDALDAGRDPTTDPTPGAGAPPRPDDRGGHAPGGRGRAGDV